MSADSAGPTEGVAPETPPCRPLGRQLALDATLHEVFGIGEAPEPTIGRYRLLRRLGAGGMSEVFLAADPKLRRKVAIKVLNQHFDAGDERRLLREGWALASVRHPGVVAVHDVGVADGRAFLVMEHVEGVTLDAWLATSPRSIAEVLRKMIPICEGLAEVHDRGVVHRDLKPSNILVDAAGHARVIDFGLVVGDGRDGSTTAGASTALVPRPGALTRDGTLAGTPAYMSPEQAGGSGELDGRSDLFSLAIVVYEAVYSARPFVGAGLEVLQAIVGLAPRTPPRRGIRERMLWRVLRRALGRRPEDRYVDMRAFGAALQRVVDRPRQVAWGLALAIAFVAAMFAAVLVPPALKVRECVAAAGAWSELAVVGEGPLGDRIRGYQSSWNASWKRACVAAHRGGDLTVDIGLPLRQACLREAQGIVEAAIGRLRAAAGEVRIERGQQILLAELPSIAACEASASARGRRPHAIEEDEAVRAVLKRVEEAEARYLTGEIAEAEATAREAVTRAEAVSHQWTRARARIALGQILRRTEAPDAAATVALLRTAANDAVADFDRVLAVQALQEAARAAVLLGHDTGPARELLGRAEAERRGLGELPAPLGPELEASAWDIRGLVAYEDKARDEAVAAHQQAVEVLNRMEARDDEGQRLLAAAYLNLGRALGDEEGAKEALDQAYELEVGLYGSEHASLASARYSQAAVALDAGNFLYAQILGEDALVLARGAGPGAVPEVARTEILLGLIHHLRGEHRDAWRLGVSAEEKYASIDGGRGVLLLQARRLVAASLRSLERHVEAEQVESRLEEQCAADTTLGADDRASILLDHAKGKIDQGDSENALRILNGLEANLGGGEAEIRASLLAVRGWALAAAGREAEAISVLQEGIVGLTGGNQRAERARSEWILAEALIKTNGDPRRICDLLNSCRDYYAAPGGDPGILASLDEIRATQRCGPITPAFSETKP